MTRGNARELAVHLIYGRGFTGEEPEKVVTTRLEKEYYKQLAEEPEKVVTTRLEKEYYKQLAEDNDVYAERPSRAQLGYLDSVVTGVANREEELNAMIQKYSIGWDVSRISKLARAVLQLAMYEILYIDDIPTGVAISEAVRIAKKYDGDDTGSFVNGILGAFARGLTADKAENNAEEA